MSLESFQFGEDEIQNLMSAEPPPETGNSFTALLDLQPNQAVKLQHSPEVFPSVMENSPKQEPLERNSSPIFVDPVILKSNKRKDREKKVKSSTKKIKIAEGERLPYVHVRARRGEATDSHSLAERARREKINARMKLLQELVPGCNKVSGTTLVLEEIINHVQSLQLQVEFLSMKLAAVHPNVNINLDSLFSSEMECNFTGMVSPSWRLDGRVNGNTQQIWHTDGLDNFVKPEISLLSYDSSANSAYWMTSQLKMEL